jgi:hypothetical protein
MIAVGAMITYFFDVDRKDSQPAYYCFLTAFICSCLFLIQMKAFYYHLVPTLIFGYAGFGLMTLGLLRKFVKKDELATLMSVAIVTAIAFFYFPAQSDAVKHDEFHNLPLAKVAEDCAPDCSIFVFSEAMEMIHEIPIYTGVTHASRFPELWWLRALLDKTDNPASAEGRAAQVKIDHYEKMMMEDMKRYHPTYMVLDKKVIYYGRPEPFYFREYFSRYPDFAAEMKHFRLIRTLHDNRGDYLKGTPNGEDHYIDYDVYKRID